MFDVELKVLKHEGRHDSNDLNRNRGRRERGNVFRLWAATQVTLGLQLRSRYDHVMQLRWTWE